MKILFIRNTDRFSGSETYDINLFLEFIRYPSLNIQLLTNLRSFAKRASQTGVTTEVISWGAEGIGTKKQLLVALVRLPVILPMYFSTIYKLEKKERFDLICFQSMTEKIFLTPIFKVLGYKLLWTELGPIYATQMSRLITFLYKQASFFVDKILTISQDTKRDLIHGGVSAKKITALYIGVDTKKFKPLSRTKINHLRNMFHIRPNAFILGYLGTVTDEKGIKDFVLVSTMILKQDKNFHFVVIGNGPFLPWVKKTVKKYKLTQNYTYSGFIDDVTKYLGIIDILFLPTRHYEGLPLAILEAQSMGKVVITSRIGGNTEIITNCVNGFLYTKLDKAAIVKRVENLCFNRSKMIQLNRQARKNIMDRFNIEIQGQKFVTFLQTL
jgi:glycosyltransferase involved in cell wall biosynthesis